MAFTLELGAKAPDFSLPGVDGKNHSLADFKAAKLLVVVFSCNHCPFVTGSEERLKALFKTYQPRGVAWVAVNSNETVTFTPDVTGGFEPFNYQWDFGDGQSSNTAFANMRQVLNQAIRVWTQELKQNGRQLRVGW